jgi:hypothetical protein
MASFMMKTKLLNIPCNLVFIFDIVEYSLFPKLVVLALSRYTCIVYLDKVETTNLGQREYVINSSSLNSGSKSKKEIC